MKRLLLLLSLVASFSLSAQERKPNRNPGGQLSLGIRNTTSLFNDAGSGVGTGFGGQFRLRFYDFLNSEWFADYIMSGFDSIGTRTDYHIGWSVMFYLPNEKKFRKYRPKPYLLAGHCFDYTMIRGNSPFYNTDNSKASRWSSAVQAGLGVHIPFSERIDLSFSGQYMIHLGKEITVQERKAVATGDRYLYVEKTDNSGLEGHLLLTCSLNIRIADIWGDRKGALGEHHAPPTDDDQNKFPQ